MAFSITAGALSWTGELPVEVMIPKYYDDELVTSIADNGFEWSSGTKISSISFEDDCQISYIGTNAFSGNNIAKLDMSVVRPTVILKEECFSGNTNMSFADISSVGQVDDNAFSGCPLVYVSISDSVTVSIVSNPFGTNGLLDEFYSELGSIRGLYYYNGSEWILEEYIGDETVIELESGASWPKDPIGHSIAFDIDDYQTKYIIAKRIADNKIVIAGKPITLGASGIKWKLFGIKKEQKYELNSITVKYANISDTGGEYKSEAE